MHRTISRLALALGFVTSLVAQPLAVHAVVDSLALCPGTGAVECVVTKKVTITDPDGIDVRPLILHVKSSGEIAADPSTPLTIHAGGFIIDGDITGNVPGGTGNTLTLISDDAVTIGGDIQAIGQAQSGEGNDGGTISVTSPTACDVTGNLIADGQGGTYFGGNGGTISLTCGSIHVGAGALIEANASGGGALGGEIDLEATVDDLALDGGSILHAVGSQLDGGSVSVSTDSTDTGDDCTLGGKIYLDAKGEGAGGSLEVLCGGDVTFGARALVSANGPDSGGLIDVFGGGNVQMLSGAAIKANATDDSGGSVSLSAGSDATIAGHIEARAGGLNDNQGSIAITTDGNLDIAKGAQLNVSAARPDMQTGQITLAGGSEGPGGQPQLSIDRGTTLLAKGYTAALGSADIDISGSACSFGGKIQALAAGQDAALIGFTCDNVALAAGSKIIATTKATRDHPSGATGGNLAIDTTGTFTTTPGDCSLAGQVILRSSSTAFRDPTTGDKRVAAGHGGQVDANCGAALSLAATGLIDVGAGGAQSVGGSVTLTAAGAATVLGAAKGKATGTFSAGGTVTVDATGIALGTPGIFDVSAESAGVITVNATGGSSTSAVVSIQKLLNATGTFGGNISVQGCDVTLASGGVLAVDGREAGGVNEIQAQNQLTVSGKMTAAKGQNFLSYSSTVSPSLGGTIKPPPIEDSSLSPCP